MSLSFVKLTNTIYGIIPSKKHKYPPITPFPTITQEKNPPGETLLSLSLSHSQSRLNKTKKSLLHPFCSFIHQDLLQNVLLFFQPPRTFQSSISGFLPKKKKKFKENAV